uniref:Neugrin n=1 Tax=Myotis myotis TaxID=51298 RepID=A0A7J7T725_MYOMY|nr:hypothetical protein mMyoMyo1_009269 [Myotis myotis]
MLQPPMSLHAWLLPLVLSSSALKRQKKAILFQNIRRQMEPRGAPPRTLTWEAMEQIRYLHEEFPESWSVPRMAEGFEVSTDVIRRVLKSKSVPTLEQKLKQDQKVFKKAGLASSLASLQALGRPGGCFLQATPCGEVKPHLKAKVTAQL